MSIYLFIFKCTFGSSTVSYVVYGITGDSDALARPLPADDPVLPMGSDDSARPGSAVLPADSRLALGLRTLRTRRGQPGQLRTHVFQLRSVAQSRNDAQLHDQADGQVSYWSNCKPFHYITAMDVVLFPRFVC